MNTIEPDTGYYDIQQKGNRDQERHLEKIKHVIKENLKELVANENIITSDGKKKVTVPVRYLDEYRFRYDPKNQDREGSGQGKGGSRKGDVLGQRPKEGSGRKPGNTHQDFQYLVEIDIDTLAEYLFEELTLPNLDLTRKAQVVDQDEEFSDRRKKGQLSNLDKKATLKEVIKRGAADHLSIDSQDLRFRTWRTKTKEVSNAVIFLLRDVSGSMGESERFLTRAICFWIVWFIRKRYDRAEIVFINYDTEAFEVDEDRFFHEGRGGGTKCLSALQLTRTILAERYPLDVWNVYAIQFSDGEDFECTDAARFLAGMIHVFNRFGYVEIEPNDSNYYLLSRLSRAYKEIIKDGNRYAAVKLGQAGEVWDAIKKLMSDEVKGIGVRP
ncbi:MAG: DUF444 family protein [Peptococcaceae bacterium]|jgi:sporulation protein YhbH|nr:DUF444 family protein [Peptococcaceae bacterium]